MSFFELIFLESRNKNGRKLTQAFHIRFSYFFPQNVIYAQGLSNKQNLKMSPMK